MPQDELAGKKTGVDEQGAFPESPGRAFHLLWQKGWATLGECQEVVRMCSEKIRKAKAQLELSLAAGVKDNKNHFYKYIRSKRRPKQNLHPLLDAAWNVTAVDKQKAEVLNVAFTSVFKCQFSYPQGTLPPGLEVSVWSRTNPPEFRWKQLETYYSTWTAASSWSWMESTQGC